MRRVSDPARSVRIRPDMARFGPIWATRGLRGPIGEPVLGHAARFAQRFAYSRSPAAFEGSVQTESQTARPHERGPRIAGPSQHSVSAALSAPPATQPTGWK